MIQQVETIFVLGVNYIFLSIPFDCSSSFAAVALIYCPSPHLMKYVLHTPITVSVRIT